VLDEAIRNRHRLVRHLGSLLEVARTSHRGAIVSAVGRVGGEHRRELETLRRRLDYLDVPLPAQICHDAVVTWLDEMIAACTAMVEVGETRQLRRLRETQEHLAASRVGARRFNSEYERLLVELRQRVDAARHRRSRLGRLRRLLPGRR
jgi:hypothetical protein